MGAGHQYLIYEIYEASEITFLEKPRGWGYNRSMRNAIIAMVALIFVAALIANLITSSHFTGMSSAERSLIIRFILTIGLFAGSIVSLTTLKNRVFAVVLGLAAIGLLFSIR